MNLHEKLLAIMSEIEYLKKDSNVSYGQTKYKAMSEEKVTKTVREKFIKHKIVMYPVEQAWERVGNVSHVDVKYRIVDTENPGDSIIIASCGDGADTQDKGSGKAMTYAYKYALLRTFAIPTGEDPDKISSEQLDDEQAEEMAKNEPITPLQGKTLQGVLKGQDVTKFFEDYGITKLSELTKEQYARAAKEIEQGKYAQPN